MKIVITGHTRGLGKAFYDSFINQGHEVIGISRSTGFDIPNDIDRIVELSTGCDLFINNTYAGDSQLQLLNRLHDKVGKMVVCGSMAGEYDKIINSQYSHDKKTLEERSRSVSIMTGNKVLYLKLTMLEDSTSSDVLVPFVEVLRVVDFWLEHPYTNRVDFEWKLTPFTLQQLKSKFNATEDSINYVLNNMCDETRSHYNNG